MRMKEKKNLSKTHMAKSKKIAMRTEWNLALFYSSLKDPQIEKDMRRIEKAYEIFEKKYRNTTRYLHNDTALKNVLDDYEALYRETDGARPIMYVAYRKELQADDHESEARMRVFENRLIKASNRIQFFELVLGSIPKNKQKEFLASKKLTPYHRYLESVFEAAKYMLSEKEEAILSLKSTTSRSMWISGVEASTSARMVQYKKEPIPVNKALNMVSALRTQKERTTLWGGVLDTLEQTSDFAESEINALFTDKKINDELRGFKEPYDATVFGYENNPKTVEDLVSVVTKGFPVSHRFFSIKKKLLGLQTMHYEDRNVSIGKIKKKFSFTDSVHIVREAYASLHPAYADILDTYLTRGQIDVYPKKGKSGGAFCSSSYANPTMVLLNHVDEPRSLMTIAHEMGHAIHAERAKTQPPLYQGHSTSVAETASTFFEGVLFDYLLREMSPKEKLVLLHDRIQDDIATIQRQIAFFNFELALHRKIRKEGWVPKKDIMHMLNTEMEAYLGRAVTMKERDGLFFVAVGHFRNPFYVYSYAYGQLISKALLREVRKDASYIEKIDQFLSAGNSKKPEQIFADIGITVGPKLFADGLLALSEDIDEFERLSREVT